MAIFFIVLNIENGQHFLDIQYIDEMFVMVCDIHPIRTLLFLLYI